jgi:UDP-N-acetylglucosamine--N-acetylmuramyl-(pentapeptide) pyrophosphoryl-undecaprenol N-acetylglucosamine transferase
MLARWVRAAAVTYAETLPYFGTKGFVAGNPVRAEFFDRLASPADRRASRPFRLLVIGGSQGSHAINVAVVGAVAVLVRAGREFVVVHQTGERDLATVRQSYEDAKVGARVDAFLDPMAREMADAHLVICRAGATTLAELAASGKPAVLVPFPAATDDHQRRNARVLADAGAVVVVEQRDLSADRLAVVVGDVMADPARLDAMGRAMQAFARPDAAERIVERLLAIAGANG